MMRIKTNAPPRIWSILFTCAIPYQIIRNANGCLVSLSDGYPRVAQSSLK